MLTEMLRRIKPQPKDKTAEQAQAYDYSPLPVPKDLADKADELLFRFGKPGYRNRLLEKAGALSPMDTTTPRVDITQKGLRYDFFLQDFLVDGARALMAEKSVAGEPERVEVFVAYAFKPGPVLGPRESIETNNSQNEAYASHVLGRIEEALSGHQALEDSVALSEKWQAEINQSGQGS